MAKSAAMNRCLGYISSVRKSKKKKSSKKSSIYFINKKLLKSIFISTLPIMFLGGSIKLFTPYFFEFWSGNENRLNKRESYHLNNEIWIKTFLQP